MFSFPFNMLEALWKITQCDTNVCTSRQWLLLAEIKLEDIAVGDNLLHFRF